MATEDLLKDILDQYFLRFKEPHLLVFGFFAALQILLAYLISRRLEKFKTVLKKSEIKFSRYHELQVEALRGNYQKLVYFDIANKSLFHSNYDSNDHNRYKARINSWTKSYSECINQLSLDKILLPEELKVLITRTIIDFEEVRNILVKEKEDLEYTEMEGEGNWHYMYEYSEDELTIINQKIERIKTDAFTEKTIGNIKDLRSSIEIYFAKMYQ